MNEKEFIPFKERNGLWDDIERVPQFSSEVKILRIDYDDQYEEISDYFRAILQKNEISRRAFDLTGEMIEVSLF